MISPQLLSEILGSVFAWVAFVLSLLMFLGLALMVAASVRQKHRETAVSAQIMLLSWSVICAFIVGWWLRNLFPPGPMITGGFGDASAAWPWSAAMGSAGFEWLRFATTSCLVSALIATSLLERVRTISLLLLCTMASAVCGPIAAAWTWDSASWLILLTGTHDAFGAGPIHALAAGFALGTLHQLGPRVAATASDGQVVELSSTTPWLQSFGSLLFIIGLFAFSASALQPFALIDGDQFTAAAIGPYGTQTSLAQVTTNLILALAGGILAGSVLGGGRPQKMLNGGIAGVVAVAAGADLYHPMQAFLIAGALTWFAFAVRARLMTRHQVDDSLGIVSWHGAAGIGGLVVAGFVLWTFPSSATADAAMINPFGNAAAAFFCFFLLGHLPAYLAARFLDYLGILRLPLAVEIAGSYLLYDLVDAQTQAEASKLERSMVRKLTVGEGT